MMIVLSISPAIIVVPVVVVALIIVVVRASLKIVKEKEVMVVERFGRFNCVLTAGIHFIVPFIDAPKVYSCKMHLFFIVDFKI
jgi:regulator of protease activity HflC (stomatin/prohibitin superfamily)